MEERRQGNDDLIFKIGEIHARTERILIIEEKLDAQDGRINKCESKSKFWHNTTSFTGGIFGGAIAIIASKLTVG